MSQKEKQTWVITGGSKGIGKCLIEYLSGIGDEVFFIDHDKTQAMHLLNVLRNERICFIEANLSSKEDINNAVNQIKSFQKKIDVIVHNAAVSKKGIHETSYEDFDETLKVNLVAPYYLTQQILPILKANASIIHIASTRALQSQSDTEAYSASKGGLIALTHALSISLKGIARVNSISPGWIDTSYCEKQSKHYDQEHHLQHPSNRIGAPMDIIRTILFLSNPFNDFINGENIIVDGGMSKQMIYHEDQGWTYKK